MPSYRDVVLADTPVGYWRLGEASGTAFTSEVGTPHGTLVGAAGRGILGPLKFDPDAATNFPADGDYFTAPNPKVVAGAGSVECWVNTSTWGDTGAHGIFQNMAYTGGSVPNAVSMFRWTGSPAPFYWRVNGSNSVVYDISPTWTTIIPTNAWAHIVGTWDATMSRLYVNGVQVGSIGITPPNAFPATSVHWARGHSSGLRGDADEFALYDYALSAAKVAAHYDAGKNQPFTGTLALVPLVSPTVTRGIAVAYPQSDFPLAYPEKVIAGIVYDTGGTEQNPVPGATVLLVRQVDGVTVSQQPSGPGGHYSFVRGRNDPYEYFVVAFSLAGGTTQVHGTSNRGLRPS